MMKIAILATFAIPFFCSGCFSILERQGEIGGSHNRKTAAALDAATLPIQAPVLVPMYINSEIKDKKSADEYERLMRTLEGNPSLAIKENWPGKSYERDQAFDNSFSNPKVKYTDDSLEKLYQTYPGRRHVIFRCEYCSKEFIAKHFDEQYELWARTGYKDTIESIVTNPNTPAQLTEKIANSKDIHGTYDRPAAIVQTAQTVLDKRRSTDR